MSLIYLKGTKVDRAHSLPCSQIQTKILKSIHHSIRLLHNRLFEKLWSFAVLIACHSDNTGLKPTRTFLLSNQGRFARWGSLAYIISSHTSNSNNFF